MVRRKKVHSVWIYVCVFIRISWSLESSCHNYNLIIWCLRSVTMATWPGAQTYEDAAGSPDLPTHKRVKGYGHIFSFVMQTSLPPREEQLCFYRLFTPYRTRPLTTLVDDSQVYQCWLLASRKNKNISAFVILEWDFISTVLFHGSSMLPSHDAFYRFSYTLWRGRWGEGYSCGCNLQTSLLDATKTKKLHEFK